MITCMMQMVEIAKELDYSPDAFLFSICAQGMDIDSCVSFLIISLSRFHFFLFVLSLQTQLLWRKWGLFWTTPLLSPLGPLFLALAAVIPGGQRLNLVKSFLPGE